MLTRCAAARSPRLAAQRGERFRVPQLTQWVVQISHLRCSLGRDALRDRDHNLRSGLYRYRTSGALWGEALSETETTTYAVGCTEIAPSVFCGETLSETETTTYAVGYTEIAPSVFCGETLSETETTTYAVGCTDIAPPVLSGARLSQKQRPQLTQWVVQKSHLRCSVGILRGAVVQGQSRGC